MITYVNTVLVSNLSSNVVFAPAENHANPTADDAGKFVIVTLDEKPVNVTVDDQSVPDPAFPYVSASTASQYDTIKIGVVTDKMAFQGIDSTTGNVVNKPIIKWSNKISADSIKKFSNADYDDDTEDIVTIDFTSVASDVLNLWKNGGKRILIRLTFKDMPTRYRKWTETYEYITKAATLSDSTAILNYKKLIVSDIVAMINKDYKRARVTASVEDNTKVKLVAMKYDDDNSVDSLNWYNKVRFNANVYYTDPSAEGWESTNKYFPTGVSIAKTPGKTYVASAKLVRDREAGAMGYEGILNRGEGTWPIIKPDMQAKLSGNYDACTIEFERMYRTADDLQRRTKECVEIYCEKEGVDVSTGITALRAILSAFITA